MNNSTNSGISFHFHDLDLVCNGNRLASMPRGAGGEWDALRDLGRRERRRLIGHGFLSARGLAPDVLAEYLGREWREVVRRDCRRPRRPGNAIETTRGSTAIVWRERWRPGNGNRRVLDLATIKRRPGFRSPANYPAWAALVDADGALTEAGRAIEGALG